MNALLLFNKVSSPIPTNTGMIYQVEWQFVGVARKWSRLTLIGCCSLGFPHQHYFHWVILHFIGEPMGCVHLLSQHPRLHPFCDITFEFWLIQSGTENGASESNPYLNAEGNESTNHKPHRTASEKVFHWGNDTSTRRRLGVGSYHRIIMARMDTYWSITVISFWYALSVSAK